MYIPMRKKCKLNHFSSFTGGAQRVIIIPTVGDTQLGTDKLFFCRAANDEEAIFKWIKPDGEEVREGTDEHFETSIIDETTSSLVIRSAREDYEGQYRCEADFGDGESDNATIFVNIIQRPTFSNIIPYQEFLEGSTAVLSCDVEGIPLPVVTWLYQGRDVSLNRDDRFSLLPNHYLKIQSIHRSDGGTYRCEARIPDRNEVEFRDISVVVNYPATAHFRKMLKNVTAGLKEISLACLLMGHPQPKVTWKRNGEELRALSGKRKFNSDRTELTVFSLDQSDEGEYTCKAENQFGQAEAKLNLTVCDGNYRHTPTYFVHESEAAIQTAEGSVMLQEVFNLRTEVRILRNDFQKQMQELRNSLAKVKEIFERSHTVKVSPTPDYSFEANLFSHLPKSESVLPGAMSPTVSHLLSASPSPAFLTAVSTETTGLRRRKKREFSRTLSVSPAVDQP
ncbi:neural cell adhesion molecule 1-like [Protopterus annectens]|uniref:neural cell adhesion molecule 1-like n=1 Tax=Protopterus annectens TaxID=7888 RepID=UPI001CF9DDFA|nr:neural cell adhesion molecule 1-like [Protopterus annectens]